MAHDQTRHENKFEPTIDEARSRFAEQRAIFDSILQVGYAIDGAISGKDAPSTATYQGAVIFTKALAHAISLGKITPVVGMSQQMYDVPSSAVLVRAISESYITFRYNAVEPVSEIDAKFRLALTTFHSRAKQFKIMKRFGIRDERLTDAAAQLEIARIALQNDAVFQLQSNAVRKSQLEGKASMHRTLEEIAETAGIHRDIWGTTYAYLSQFAHTSPFAVRHAGSFRADSPSGPSSLSMMLQMAAGFMAKFVNDIGAIFPGSTEKLSSEQQLLIALEAAVLERLSPG